MRKKLIGLSVVFLFLVAAFVNVQAAILKVGPSETYTTIQAAIDAAAATGDEIWVQQGTYTLSATIDIGKAVSLYGGFTGSETARDERSTDASLTIIDGNTSVRCFKTYNTITIDGFTITKGDTSSDSSNGAGIWNGDSTGEIEIPGYLTLNNCILSNNSAGNSAGAIFNDWGTLTVSNCAFNSNTANSARAGAIENYGHDMTITNCTFTGNTANNGGAIYYPNTSGTPSATANNVFTDCVFSENSALSGTSDGGAIVCDANTTMTRCIFEGNTANRRGGAIAFYGDGGFSHVFTNCLFTGNTALEGAAIALNGSKSGSGGMTAVNCTFADNTLLSGGLGGAIFMRRTGLATGAVFAVMNSILWGNDGNAIDRTAGSSNPLPTVSYSDLDQTGYAGTITNSINEDPDFVDATNGDYHLQGTSPCINTATSTGAPADDIEGTTRPQGAGYDMGAYEYVVTLITLSSFDAIPGSQKVSLTWATESEIDNAGFNIYRAEENGEFVQINDEIIPAQGSATSGATYEFVDEDVQNRTTYSYKLEDVDANGVSTMHGPKSATPRLIYLLF